jgi:hypothetical protein
MPERAPVAPVQLTVHSILNFPCEIVLNFLGCNPKAFVKVLHCSNFYVEFRTVVLLFVSKHEPFVSSTL